MVPAATIYEVLDFLNGRVCGRRSAMIQRVLNHEMGHRPPETIGFIVMDQDVAQGEAVPFLRNLNVLHRESHHWTHFFMCGFSKFGADSEGAVLVGELDNMRLFHNAEQFVGFCAHFEQELPGWTCSGFDLILVDVVPVGEQWGLDWEAAVPISIRALLRASIAANANECIGKFIRLTRRADLRNARQIKSAYREAFQEKWIWSFLQSMFPTKIRELSNVMAALR